MWKHKSHHSKWANYPNILVRAEQRDCSQHSLALFHLLLSSSFVGCSLIRRFCAFTFTLKLCSTPPNCLARHGYSSNVLDVLRFGVETDFRSSGTDVALHALCVHPSAPTPVHKVSVKTGCNEYIHEMQRMCEDVWTKAASGEYKRKRHWSCARIVLRRGRSAAPQSFGSTQKTCCWLAQVEVQLWLLKWRRRAELGDVKQRAEIVCLRLESLSHRDTRVMWLLCNMRRMSWNR